MSLGLVNYGTSSDEGDDDDDDDNVDEVKSVKTVANDQHAEIEKTDSVSVGVDDEGGFISDSDDDVAPVATAAIYSDTDVGYHSLVLPEPVFNTANDTEYSVDNNGITNDTSTDKTLFSALPAPVSASLEDEYEEAEIIVLPTASEIAMREKPPPKKKVIIELPSLPSSDSDSDEEKGHKAKRQKTSGKSELFQLLPKPKTGSLKEVGRPLIPHTLTKRRPSNPVKHGPTRTTPPIVTVPTQGPQKASISQAVGKAQQNRTILTGLGYASDDDDDGGESSGNFFSLGQETALPVFDPSSSLTDEFLEHVESKEGIVLRAGEFLRTPDVPLYFNQSEAASTSVHDWGSTQSNTSNHASCEFDDYTSYELPGEAKNTPTEDYYQDEQFLRMQGKKQRRKEEINMIDVHVDDQVGGFTLEQTKDLTKEVDMISHSKKRNPDMPTSQQKRKHQITYLAHQAKEREIELKNQWSENRFTKKQTQSKYGF